VGLRVGGVGGGVGGGVVAGWRVWVGWGGGIVGVGIIIGPLRTRQHVR